MSPSVVPPAGYGDFLHEVKVQIRQRQYQALRAANKELLTLYWWLGEVICRKQAEQGWAKLWSKPWPVICKWSFRGATGFLPKTCG